MKSDELKIAKMLATIRAHEEYTKDEFPGISISEKILKAMSKVPREPFVPSNIAQYAYDDSPLSIGYGQTISQPYIVALMLELLKPTADAKVLEIGTGSGYNAAVLSKLVKDVFTIEVVPDLLKKAEKVFSNLSITNIKSKCDDGNLGWYEYAPFDGIIVTAYAESIPPKLIEQLKIGGRMIIPLEKNDYSQKLSIIKKQSNAKLEEIETIEVRFVPLIKN